MFISHGTYTLTLNTQGCKWHRLMVASINNGTVHTNTLRIAYLANTEQ